MFVNKRTSSNELLIKRCLYPRWDVPDSEIRQLSYDEKGYEGELAFDALIENYPPDTFVIVSDLLFEMGHSYAQADSILLSQSHLNLFEVKNFEGEHYMEAGKLYTASGFELKSPFDQVERTETLLRKKLQSIGVKIPIESHVVFINPNFSLFQAPFPSPQLILPTQLSFFLQKFTERIQPYSKKELDLANQLISIHQTKSPYSRVPSYTYEQVRKGLFCQHCKQYSLKVHNQKVICKLCKHEESIWNAITRGMREYKILFPERPITLSTCVEWCDLGLTKRQYQHFLKTNLKLFGQGRYSYYQFK